MSEISKRACPDCGRDRLYDADGLRMYTTALDTCPHGGSEERLEAGEPLRDEEYLARLTDGETISCKEVLEGQTLRFRDPLPTDPTLDVLEKLAGTLERLCEVLELAQLRHHGGEAYERARRRLEEKS